MAVSFEARHEGLCPNGDDIERGETVVHDDDGVVWHTACLRTTRSRAVNPPARYATACPECWLIGPCEHRV